MSADRDLVPQAPPAPRLRVLFLTSIFPNPAQPTLGTFHEQLAKALHATCDLTVVSPLPWFPVSAPGLPAMWQQYARIPSEYRVGGQPVFSSKYVMLPRVSESVRPMLMLPGLARLGRRLHRERPFDVIAGLWLYPDGVAAAWLSRFLRVPLVLTGLGCDVNLCLEEPLQRFQILKSVDRASQVIVVADALKTRLVAAGVKPEKVTTIPNGVDEQLFGLRDRDVAAEQLSLPRGERRLVFVGRLSEEKGVPFLIRAMADLSRRRPATTLYVVGDGADRQMYESQVRELGLSDRVRFVGARHHDEIATWIGAGDLLCLPSLREGCPNVVMEALSSGRPVVASKVGGIPDLVTSETGALVPPGDPQSLSDALCGALERDWSPSTIRGSVASKSWTHAAASYLSVFRAAAHQGTGRVSTPAPAAPTQLARG